MLYKNDTIRYFIECRVVLEKIINVSFYVEINILAVRSLVIVQCCSVVNTFLLLVNTIVGAIKLWKMKTIVKFMTLKSPIITQLCNVYGFNKKSKFSTFWLNYLLHDKSRLYILKLYGSYSTNKYIHIIIQVVPINMGIE